MDHSEWAQQLKAALALKCKSPNSAIRALRSLAKSAARESRTSVGDWHVEQTSALEAVILSESGEHKKAALLCRRINQQNMAQFTYYGRALASSLAFEAFELSACGQNKRARRIATEAMGYFKAYPESSTTYKKLVKLLEAQAAKPKTVRRGRKRSSGA